MVCGYKQKSFKFQFDQNDDDDDHHHFRREKFHSLPHFSFIRWKRKQQGENFPGHKSNIDDDSF